MEAQYLKNNHVTYYVITQGGVSTPHNNGRPTYYVRRELDTRTRK